MKIWETGRSGCLQAIAVLILSALGAALQSCSDDVDIKGGILTSDGETGITLYLPDIEGAAEFGATRAENPVGNKTIEIGTGEAAIHDLYLVAIDSERAIFKIDLTKISSTKVGDNYKAYTISIKEGTYSFYLLANMDSYLNGKVEALSDEQAVTEAILNFKDKVPGTLKSGNLPMACLASQMKTSPGASAGSAETVKISAGNNTSVYADMHFLCSKVRYTILFDKGSFSDKFTTTDVNFKDAEALNIRNESPLVSTFPVDATYGEKMTGLQLFRAEYPDEESAYLKTGNVETIPEDLKVGTWDEDAVQKAWQGIVYLPENLSEDSSSKLNFYGEGSEIKTDAPYSLNLYWKHQNTSEQAHGLARSNFYDIIVKLITPEAVDLEEQLEIEVWPWNPQELVYRLHGPYELIVEQSKLDEVQSGFWTTLNFKSNVSDEDIYFESPKIKIDGKEEDFFTPFVVKRGETDDDGNEYEFKTGWSMMRITVNSNIPYKVIRQLTTGGNVDGKTLEDFKYFHIVAGNLHKKIDIDLLTLTAYLIVDPLKINIDVRQYYTSGIPKLVEGEDEDDNEDLEKFLKINFHTNFDSSDDSGVTLTVADPDKLFKGLDLFEEYGESVYAFKLRKCDGIEGDGEDDIYHITKSSGTLFLDLRGLLRGLDYWKSKHEYTLTFTLTFPEAENRRPIVRTVTITVVPFTTNYTIHFYDNTKEWDSPHIYIYQMLTLPSDLSGTSNDRKYNYADFAGKIVGFVEKNVSSGIAWNAAAQYVFTNNLGFRGWKGYGGPSINDPTPEIMHYSIDVNDEYFTKGYVLFGNKTDWEDNNHYNWNLSYDYTEANTDWDTKHQRYNFELNFNEDHQKTARNKWLEYCMDCYNLKGDYNGADDKRFYTGIAMEKEDENPGWYKYTLTGVAQPGRTIIVFANKHFPWNEIERDYYAEDFRYPGDYEAGVPLFDYPDNEGWFVFNGNSSNSNQHFTDSKPTNLRSHTFTVSMASKLVIDIVKPTTGKTISKVRLAKHSRYYDKDRQKDAYPADDYDDNHNEGADDDNNDHQYADYDSNSAEWVDSNGRLTLNMTDGKVKDLNYFDVKVFFSDGTKKAYTLAPKNFQLKDGKYQLIDPLYTEFVEGLPIYVKWNDHVKFSDQGWAGDYGYYVAPEADGSNFLSVYWGNNGEYIDTYVVEWDEAHNKRLEVGNYKHVQFDTKAPGSPKDRMLLKLCTSAQDGNFGKILRIEDLPGCYNPEEKFYQVNWHLLRINM